MFVPWFHVDCHKSLCTPKRTPKLLLLGSQIVLKKEIREACNEKEVVKYGNVGVILIVTSSALKFAFRPQNAP